MKLVFAVPFALGLLASSSAALAAGPSSDPAAPPAARAGDPDRVATPSEPVRFRFGFSLNGGGAVGGASGPVMGAALRLGAQLHRMFGVYYQQSPNAFLVATNDGVAAGFMDMNSVLASFTFVDPLELSIGPSLDYLALGGCSSEGCNAASGTHFGVHGRVALHLGGRNPTSGRRSAFTIGVDAHPIFTGGESVVLVTGGLGAEFY
jgi:hypothetical protein